LTLISHTEFFGVLSTLMMVLSRANYFNSIFRGKTRPHAFSWFIWGIISSIGFAAQVAEGAGAGSWARGFSAFTCFILVIVALIKGEKVIITKTPVWSVMLVCIIDTIGYFPTLRKSWTKPQEEAAQSYLFGSLCALFSLFAIEHYTLSTWLYPAVLTWSNGSMAGFLAVRRRQISAAHDAAPPALSTVPKA
jgi:hypothetical protein